MAAGDRSKNFNPAVTAMTMLAGIGCGGAGTIRRIRQPNPQDVLSGRGGGINSHPGNKAFRQWISERKEKYNLARNKKDKTTVATEVVRQVQQQNPPGRFLTKDTSVIGGNGGHWWIEVDETRALAKITQALREGAPKIRMAHHHPPPEPDTASSTNCGKGKPSIKKRKRKNSVQCSPTKKGTKTKTKASQIKVKKEELTEDYGVSLLPSSIPSYKSEQMLLPTCSYEHSHVRVDKIKHFANQQESLESDEQQQQNQYEKIQQLHNQVQEHHPFNLVAPLTNSMNFNGEYYKRFNSLAMSTVDPFAETPPLMAAEEPDFANEIPSLRLDVSDPTLLDSRNTYENNNGRNSNSVVSKSWSPTRKRKLPRVHSLVLEYDNSTDMNLIMGSGDVEFVNPFADESKILSGEDDFDVIYSTREPFSVTDYQRTVAATEIENSDPQSPPSF